MDQGNYQQVYDSLGSTYQPQTDLVNSQIAALPGQQQAQQSALDQAKVNAFKDITNSANSKGVLFSGVPIDQQATYTGTKYLPAVANLQTSFNNTKNTLLGQINSINADRSKQASASVSAYQAEQAKQAYHNAQLQLSYARLAQSGRSGGITPYQQTQLDNQNVAQYKTTQDANGNYKFIGPGGSPINLAQFVAARGGNINNVLDLLKTGSAYDQKAYNSVSIQLANKKIGADPGSIAKAIAQYDTKNYYGLR